MRKFEPLPGEHPLVRGEERCPVCLQEFKEGDEVTLISAERGSGTVQARALHWKCVEQIASDFVIMVEGITS